MTKHFFAINNIGSGLSGGDSIWVNLAKRWSEVLIYGCKASYDTAVDNNVPCLFRFVCPRWFDVKNKFSLWGIFVNFIGKLCFGTIGVLICWSNFQDGDIIYSVSDFYPDFVPALIIKLLKPKVQWVAGFYLFAPSPFSKDNPYHESPLRGFLYWLSQRVSYPTIRKFADVVFVTSDIDKDKFPKTVVVKGGV